MGYAPSFSSYSPGQVLLQRVIDDLIEQDTPKWFDFGYGHNQYKEVFANHQTMSGPVILVRRGLKPLTVLWLDQAQRKLARRTRASLHRIGLLSRLRKLYRR